MTGEHATEVLMDWQYGVTFWLALVNEPRLADEPPEGEGWMINADVGDGGHRVKIPTWSDGSIVMRSTYWLRPSPGMRHWRKGAYVQVDRRPWWRGSKVPDRIRTGSDDHALGLSPDLLDRS